jgi:hypothetical protein
MAGDSGTQPMTGPDQRFDRQAAARRVRQGVWLVAVGVMLVAIGWLWQRDRMGMPETALRLPAQVIAIEQRVQTVADTEETLYAPRVRFIHPDGREVVFISDVWTQTSVWREGEAIGVLVDPASGRAIVDSTASIYGTFMLFAGIGGLLAGIGLLRIAGGTRAAAAAVTRAGSPRP